MPIDQFGAAMLKGMGWKKGDPVGKTNKGLVCSMIRASLSESCFIIVYMSVIRRCTHIHYAHTAAHMYTF